MSGIKIGDQVRLRSGGPRMTVHSFGVNLNDMRPKRSDDPPAASPEYAHCVWFVPGNAEAYSGRFPLAGLRPVKMRRKVAAA